jgi:transcriptional regulator with XRE-family HTH domain
LSQNDLAFYAGLDRSYLASVESGKRNVSIVNIEKITSALEVSLKDFFDALDFEEIVDLK